MPSAEWKTILEYMKYLVSYGKNILEHLEYLVLTVKILQHLEHLSAHSKRENNIRTFERLSLNGRIILHGEGPNEKN